MSETLEARYRSDPVLLDFYRANLGRRGWAGKLDDFEKEYLRGSGPEWYRKARVRGGLLAQAFPVRGTREQAPLDNGKRGQSAGSSARSEA